MLLLLLMLVLVLIVFAEIADILQVTNGIFAVGGRLFFVGFSTIFWGRGWRLPISTSRLIRPPDVVVISGSGVRLSSQSRRNFAVDVRRFVPEHCGLGVRSQLRVCVVGVMESAT